MELLSFSLIVALAVLLVTAAALTALLMGIKLLLGKSPKLSAKQALPMWVLAMPVSMFGVGMVTLTAGLMDSQLWEKAQLEEIAGYVQAQQAPAPLTDEMAEALVQKVRAGYADKERGPDVRCGFDELFAGALEETLTLAQYNRIRESAFAKVQEEHCEIVTAINDLNVRLDRVKSRFPTVVPLIGDAYRRFVVARDDEAVKALHAKMTAAGVSLAPLP